LGDFIEDAKVLSPVEAATIAGLRESTQNVLAGLTAREAKVRLFGRIARRAGRHYQGSYRLFDDGPISVYLFPAVSAVCHRSAGLGRCRLLFRRFLQPIVISGQRLDAEAVGCDSC